MFYVTVLLLLRVGPFLAFIWIDPIILWIKASNPILGEGRFGTVFEAEFTQKATTDTVDGIGMKKCKNDKNSTKPISENEKIAVKMLKKNSVIDQDAVMQIIEEIRIHSVCSGLPHVLKFFKAWQTERHLFVALSLCQRGSLADLFRTRQMPFSSQSVILAANQLYQGEEQYLVFDYIIKSLFCR